MTAGKLQLVIDNKQFRSRKRGKTKKRKKRASFIPEIKSSPVTKFESALMNSATIGDGQNFIGIQSKPTCLDLTIPLNSIAQGTGNGKRIGNKIQVKHLWYRAIFSNTDLVYKRLCYKLVFCRLKQTSTVPNLDDFKDLFKDGNGNAEPENTLIQQYMPFNKNVFTILKTVKFKLTPAADEDNVITKDGYGVYKTVMLDLKKYLPKYILYDNNDVTQTNSKGIYCFILAATIGEPVPIGQEQTQFYTVQHSAAVWAEYADP